MWIAEKIVEIKSQLPVGVKLVAVSKTKPIEAIWEAYNAGQRIFGENKVQEMTLKYESLPKDIEWHYIGHLQTNKIKYIAPYVSLIHAVDSLKLLEAIDKEAAKNHRVIDCLLQFHIAKEETKFGLSEQEAEELLLSERFSQLHNVQIAGVMGMATFTDNTEQIRNEFETLHQLFLRLKNEFFSDDPNFTELSMGMSDDFSIALKQGSTMIRIGSTIFGAREYLKNV
jgi:pyridoxal phosphate enzyme (YggS family)